jgi:hypothetical protein
MLIVGKKMGKIKFSAKKHFKTICLMPLPDNSRITQSFLLLRNIMKLINKFTSWYLGISAFVFLVGGILTFYSFESHIEIAQAKEQENFAPYLSKN